MLPLDTSVVLPALGWVGAAGTIAAYGLVTQGRLAPGSRTFQGVNAIGAGLLALSAAAAQSWPSTAVNVLWSLIGLQAFLAATWMRSAARRAAVDPRTGAQEHVARPPRQHAAEVEERVEVPVA